MAIGWNLDCFQFLLLQSRAIMNLLNTCIGHFCYYIANSVIAGSNAMWAVEFGSLNRPAEGLHQYKYPLIVHTHACFLKLSLNDCCYLFVFLIVNQFWKGILQFQFVLTYFWLRWSILSYVYWLSGFLLLLWPPVFIHSSIFFCGVVRPFLINTKSFCVISEN